MKRSIFFVLITFAVISVSVITVQQRQHLQQYAAGNSVTVSPGDNLSQKISNLSPGDTLILNDGVYTGQLAADNIHGTATAPITIQAANDGKAIIDGGGNTNYQAVLEVKDSSYVNVKGLVVHNGGNEVVGVYNSSDHITLQRITGYDAGKGNQHIFDVAYGPTNVVVEDCAGWGNGRYVFIAYHANNVVFRRTWAKWTAQSNFSPAPRSCYGVYGASDVILENTICWNAIPTSASDTDYFTAQWQTTDGPTTNNISYYGVMFYNNWEGLYVNDLSQSQNTKIVDSFFENNRLQGGFTLDRDHGDGIAWHISNGGEVTNNTFVNNEKGFQSNGAKPTLTNNVFVGNDTASDVSDANGDLWKNKSNGSASSSDKQVDPGYDTTTYGMGAYLFIPQNSPLKAAGQSGSDIGANIIYEYENGQLTTTPLWPWPMEDRIKAETGHSVTWESGGGFWKTLNGVYGNTPNPSSSSNSITVSLALCPHGLGNCGDNIHPGSGGNTTPQHQARSIKISFLNSANQEVGAGQGTVNYSGGNFSGTVPVSNIPDGQYLLSVKMDGFLSKQIPGIISIVNGQTVTIPSISLVTGDINNDNQLDILDYNLLIACFGTKQTSASCTNAHASDINDDGLVNATDYNLFLRELSVQKGN